MPGADAGIAIALSMQTIRDDPSGPPSLEGGVVRGETLNEVLATQARDRGKVELWAGTIVGAANAGFMWARFPSLHWLAAGFAATACYGAWGLIDRKLSAIDESNADTRVMRILMRLGRFATGAAGWICALFAVAAFLTAALGGLCIPGR
jgi:hypothetical protein